MLWHPAKFNNTEQESDLFPQNGEKVHWAEQKGDELQNAT